MASKTRKFDIHSVSIFNRPHPRVNKLLFEFLHLRLEWREVDRRAVLYTRGVDVRVHGLDLSIVALKDGVFQEQAESRHLGNEEQAGSVELEE